MAIDVNIVVFQCQFLIQPLRNKIPHSSRPKHTTHTHLLLPLLLPLRFHLFECTVANRRWRLKMSPTAVEAPLLLLFLLAAALLCPLGGARLLVEMTVVRNASSIGACKWKRFGSFFKIIFWNLIGLCLLYLDED